MTETARPAGAIGATPIIPSYLLENKDKYFLKSILDFGCGKTGRHVNLLASHGFAVWGEDLALVYSEDPNENIPTWLHKPGKKYDLVYANSVINVQPNLNSAFGVIRSLGKRTNPGGTIVFTVAKDPWRLEDLSPSAFRYLLTVDRMMGFTPITRKKDSASWIWVCHKPKL